MNWRNLVLWIARIRILWIGESKMLWIEVIEYYKLGAIWYYELEEREHYKLESVEYHELEGLGIINWMEWNITVFWVLINVGPGLFSLSPSCVLPSNTPRGCFCTRTGKGLREEPYSLSQEHLDTLGSNQVYRVYENMKTLSLRNQYEWELFCGPFI